MKKGLAVAMVGSAVTAFAKSRPESGLANRHVQALSNYEPYAECVWGLSGQQRK